MTSESTSEPLRIFIGWDPREAEAFHVFTHSLVARASKPIQIIPLVQQQLRQAGLYTRSRDERAATEFSLTRFLVPYLSGYRGVSIFADCDMLCRTDIWRVLEERVGEHAPVWVCKHDYVPRDAIKMDGQAQTTYPRKNWSSFMVFDNAECKRLSPDYVNRVAPSELHRFYWTGNAPDGVVGSVPIEWNWLVGEYDGNAEAKNLHYTNGGPWFENYRECDSADLWIEERERMRGITTVAA
jgi:hypothetical protein